MISADKLKAKRRRSSSCWIPRHHPKVKLNIQLVGTLVHIELEIQTLADSQLCANQLLLYSEDERGVVDTKVCTSQQ